MSLKSGVNTTVIRDTFLSMQSWLGTDARRPVASTGETARSPKKKGINQQHQTRLGETAHLQLRELCETAFALVRRSIIGSMGKYLRSHFHGSRVFITVILGEYIYIHYILVVLRP